MRTEGGSFDAAPHSTVRTAAETIICPSCERQVAAGSLYCPYCCGEDGRRGATKRGAFVGGVFGLLAGGLLTALWSSVVGPEKATWGVVFAITIGGGVFGMVVGAISNRWR
ncbi:hypothetical protein [Accumulibacter sp.]|uniref:hypothetical protein n=1 Tax=Accumulibacter sp. TaxID=2053492 RepID=UPI00261DA28A|nr:hypothetical protein [Accumulibacter sp.]